MQIEDEKGARTRCYKFGIRFVEKSPEHVQNHLRAYGTLYNNYIEVLSEAKEQFRAMRRRMSPEYARLEEEMAALDEEVKAIFDKIKKRSQKEKKRTEKTPEEEAALDAIYAKKDGLIERMRKVYAALKKKAAFKAEAKKHEEKKKALLAKVKETRQCTPYTGDQVLKSALQADMDVLGGKLRFGRFAGGGRICVQFHAEGLTDAGQAQYADLKARREACKKLRERLVAGKISQEEYDAERKSRRLLEWGEFKAARARLPRKDTWRVSSLFDEGNPKLVIGRPAVRYQRFRTRGGEQDEWIVTTEKALRRDPVPGRIKVGEEWVDFTLIPSRLRDEEREEYGASLHPRLSEDAEIKEAYITRKKLGQGCTTHLCLNVREPAPKSAKGNKVAVVFPHFKKDGDRTVVATVFNGDNVETWSLEKVERKLHSEERGDAVIKVDAIDVMEHADDIKKKEGAHFEAMRSALREWMTENTQILPKWLKEEKKLIFSDRFKPGHMVNLLKRTWANARFKGDKKIFEALRPDVERRLMHYYNWWTREGRAACEWRDKRYEYLAYHLVNDRSVGRIIIATTDRAKLAKRSSPDQKEKMPEAVRLLRKRVALSYLESAVRSAAANAGVVVDEVKEKRKDRTPEEFVIALHAEATRKKAKGGAKGQRNEVSAAL